MSLQRTQPARPALWAQLSILSGNAIQLAGLIGGALLLYLAAHLHAAGGLRIVLMLAGFLAIYICCHAIAHWLAGSLVGIRFRAYGLRGTDHPETYPPGFRQLMSIMPFFTAMTEKGSMRQAGRGAKALMFAAGETSSTVCSLLAAGYAWRSGIPGGNILFFVMVIFNAIATVTTSITPRGDYTKARRALQGPAPQ
jgi:hypothetical protein